MLAVFFFIAAYFFLTAYNRYAVRQEKKEALTVRVRILKQQQREAERKKRIISRVNDFMNRAGSFGLEKNRWSVYDINIDEPVTFFEIEQILNQCQNSSAYYFKPISLYAKTPQKSDKNRESDKKKTKKTTSADSRETREGDIMLTLRGAFVVRED